MNIAILVGGLTRDPEMRYTPSGQAVTTFSLATDAGFREGQRLSDYHNIVVWGAKNSEKSDTAQRCATYLKKGSQVAVRGRITTRKWETQEGQERRTTEIIADSWNGVDFISNFKSKEEVDGQSQSSSYSSDVDPDDIPF